MTLQTYHWVHKHYTCLQGGRLHRIRLARLATGEAQQNVGLQPLDAHPLAARGRTGENGDGGLRHTQFASEGLDYRSVSLPVGGRGGHPHMQHPVRPEGNLVTARAGRHSQRQFRLRPPAPAR